MATNVDTYRAAQNNESLTAGHTNGDTLEKDFSNGLCLM